LNRCISAPGRDEYVERWVFVKDLFANILSLNQIFPEGLEAVGEATLAII
jgi:hypothetical protein